MGSSKVAQIREGLRGNINPLIGGKAHTVSSVTCGKSSVYQEDKGQCIAKGLTVKVYDYLSSPETFSDNLKALCIVISYSVRSSSGKVGTK